MTARTGLLLASVVGALGTGALFAQRQRLVSELQRITAASESANDAVATARLAADIDRVRLELERARSLTARTAGAHLALALGDGQLTLERGEIVLRSTVVDADVPRGVHRIESVGDALIGLTGGISLVPRSPRDSGDAPAGTIRVARIDFDAIRPNVRVGLMAYFF